MQNIRPPAVAGTFYPANRDVLVRNVRALLESVISDSETFRPKALIVPHAGYVYSGNTAASAYACLSSFAQEISRVVLLGPVHRVAVKGLALPDVAAFDTPLGTVKLDQQAIQAIAALPQVVVSSAAHAAEHSLEVQLPFLQSVLGNFKLVPFAVGQASAAEVAEVLDALWGGPETLIVISSDLSHFLSYEEANKIDGNTVQSILALEPLRTHHQACGATPINGMLLAALHHHLHPKLIGLCNSGDTAGDKNRVVGYASFAFVEETADE